MQGETRQRNLAAGDSDEREALIIKRLNEGIPAHIVAKRIGIPPYIVYNVQRRLRTMNEINLDELTLAEKFGHLRKMIRSRVIGGLQTNDSQDLQSDLLKTVDAIEGEAPTKKKS